MGTTSNSIIIVIFLLEVPQSKVLLFLLKLWLFCKKTSLDMNLFFTLWFLPLFYSNTQSQPDKFSSLYTYLTNWGSTIPYLPRSNQQTVRKLSSDKHTYKRGSFKLVRRTRFARSTKYCKGLSLGLKSRSALSHFTGVISCLIQLQSTSN